MPPPPPPPDDPSPRAALHQLHSILNAIELPKSKTAKVCSVNLDSLLNARSIAKNLAEKYPALPDQRYTELASKLDSLASSISKIQSLKPTYASVTAPNNPISNSSPPLSLPAGTFPRPTKRRNTDFDITFTTKDPNHRAFLHDSPSDIKAQFNKLMIGMEFARSRDDPMISCHAIAKHRNGDIRITLHSKEDMEYLRDNISKWLPAFSSQLKLRERTYAVAMHHVPTSFTLGDSEDWEDDVRELQSDNEFAIPGIHDCLVKAHWVSRLPIKRLRELKTHSTLVLHFSDPATANQCINQHLVLNGRFHRTEKYRPQPTQCFNCHRFGHLAIQCKNETKCGFCTKSHKSSECLCTHPTPCSQRSQCTHLAPKCALCDGPHRASHPDCPVRQAVFQRCAMEHIKSGATYICTPGLESTSSQ